MNLLKILLLVFLLYGPAFTPAQGIAIGQWRDHLPYNHVISVADAGDRIYAATPYNLFYYQKSDNSVHRLTKINALSDFGIRSISYSNEYKTLVVAYSNTNIDLIRPGKVVNIPDIKRKPILGNKTINRIMIRGPLAYLCAGFGIVVVDLIREEIRDTYYIGPDGTALNVLDMTSDGEYLFAATEKGLYKARLNHPNLADYQAWERDNQMPGPLSAFNAIALFNNRLVINKSNPAFNKDTLFYRDAPGGNWHIMPNSEAYTKNAIRVTHDNRLIVVNNGDITTYDTAFQVLGRTWTYLQPDTSYLPYPLDVVLDKDNHFWIADRYQGLVRNWNTWSIQIIKPDGPFTNGVYGMSLINNSLWVVPGGMNLQWGNNYIPATLSQFSQEKWTSLDRTNLAAFDTTYDLMVAVQDPGNPARVMVATWGLGVYEFRNNKLVNVYNKSNSTLSTPGAIALEEIKVGGIAFDGQGNLWASNSGANNLLSVLKPNGEWQSFALGNLAFGATQVEVGKLIIDRIGQKWALMRGSKVLVFNDNQTLSQTSDDKAAILTSGIGKGNLPGSRVFSIAMDRDGEVWVGTDAGVAIFYTPENVFSGYNFDAQQVLVEEGGYLEPLLEKETVTAIAVDGANRKWLGTDRAGVFLMSPDGTQQILNFNTTNSPLLSNTITDIAINHETGEVFFGTDAGIISYKATATAGREVNENVYAYPNPVREGYEGPIAVKGLVTDADVKITDISGALVYSTRAEGGQAIWHGKNFAGDRVSTGVYLVFITNEDGSETMVSKILVIH